MLTHYVIHDDHKPPQSPSIPMSRQDVIIERQDSASLDVVPGLLDLPSGTLPYDFVELYLKVLALFNEHIIVPDGWLHCQGPLSEHLRWELREAEENHPQGQHGNWAVTRTIPELLRAGVIVPGLRGERPDRSTDSLLGFNIHDVWSGRVQDERGQILPFGVAGFKEKDRMSILDPDKENAELLKMVARNTSKFIDWTTPTIPLNEAGYHSKSGREQWDMKFGNLVKDIILDSPTQALSTEGIRLLYEERAPLPSADLLGVVREFYEQLMDGLRIELRDPEKFRRGSVEKAVANAMGFGRFTGYDRIISEPDHFIPPVPNPVVAHFLRSPTLLHLRPLLARVVLDQVTLAQQSMFAEKFNASLGLGLRSSIDLIDRGLMKRSRLEVDVQAFERFNEPIIKRKLALNRLTAAQIIDLRGRNKAYFEAARQVVPSEKFWSSNPDFAAATRNYAKDIAAAIPLSETSRTVIRGTRRAVISGGLSLVANQWFSGIQFAVFGFPIVWWAQKTIKPIAKFLTNGLDTGVENIVQKHRQKNCADLLLQAMQVEATIPESIRNGSA